MAPPPEPIQGPDRRFRLKWECKRSVWLSSPSQSVVWLQSFLQSDVTSVRNVWSLLQSVQAASIRLQSSHLSMRVEDISISWWSCVLVSFICQLGTAKNHLRYMESYEGYRLSGYPDPFGPQPWSWGIVLVRIYVGRLSPMWVAPFLSGCIRKTAEENKLQDPAQNSYPDLSQ